jgi:hypothetical protein
MMENQNNLLISISAWAVVIIGVGILFAVFRKRGDATEPQIEIARIVDRGLVGPGAGAIGFMFAVATLFCFVNYFVASTTDRQIVALLLWIANSAFWGVCLLANLISQGRTSTVYRDPSPAERQEPPL